MSAKPFIHKFKTNKFHYIYDVNTNQIIRVDNCIYDIIDYYKILPAQYIIQKFKSKYSSQKIKKALTNIEKSHRKLKVFSDFRPQKMAYPKSKKSIIKKLKTGITQLILNVTESCNMRCKYCVYSGTYFYERPHTNKNMSFATAKKAIDFFLRHSTKSKKRYITFYGGEPLLNFKLIKKCIDYTNSKKIENIRYNLTTNGTLLTDKTIKYFIKNKVSVLISLDGPKEVHDKYRVFANQKGSFSKIISGVEKIIGLDPDYFKTYVGFSSTIAPPYENMKIYKFFTTDTPFKKNISSISYVSRGDTNFFKKFPDDRTNIKKYYSILMKKFLDILIRGNKNELAKPSFEFLRVFFGYYFVRIHSRSLKSLRKTVYPNGICLPGERRLFVSPDGNFYACEKINYHFKLGDIKKGFNYKAIFDLIDKYCKISQPDCLNCWAVRLCSLCFVSAKEGDKLSRERKQEKCRNMLDALHSNLKYYALAREKNPDAFSYVKDLVYNI